MPLAGVVVRWLMHGGARDGNGERARSARPIQLGTATTGSDGDFEIAPDDTPEAGQALCGLVWQPDAKSYFRLGNDEREAVEVPFEQALGEEGATIRIAGGTEPDTGQWRALSAY
ncbi:MAG TPA: hypothetical protein VIP76_03765, partial [Luteimonas sp.]